MKISKFILLAAVFFSTFISCKKGEDDPLISLRTRKARVVGEWKIKSGSETFHNVYTGNNTNLSTISTSYTNSHYSRTQTYSDSAGSAYSDTYTGSVSYNMSFKKNGEFFSEIVTDNQTTTTRKGTWNFTSGIGTHKNKEQIVIHLESYSNNYSYSGSFVQSVYSNAYKGNTTDITYEIKELRNKKIVLSSDESYLDSYENEYSSSSELTFEQ